VINRRLHNEIRVRGKFGIASPKKKEREEEWPPTPSYPSGRRPKGGGHIPTFESNNP
jgi:hypothetical protein